MKTILSLTILFFGISTVAQEKKLWAKSFINQKAAPIVVEEWLTEKPKTKGKFVLIDFWATWCGPCKKAIPELNKFQTEFKEDLVIIGISDETKEKVAAFQKVKIEYYSAIDASRNMYNYYGVTGIPHCILIDPKGIIRWEGFPFLTNYELTSEVIQTIIEKYKK